MKNKAEFMARHPVLIGAIFAVVAGFGAYNTFKAGMTYAGLRVAVADHARVASEALGG